jgi:hypothetical protein
VRRALASLALAAIGALPAGSAAQSTTHEATLLVLLPAQPLRDSEPPAVRAINMLGDRTTREQLNSGFPARLHYRLELWEAQSVFDHLVSTVEWDVVVRYDPLARHYTVTRVAGRVTLLGTFAELKDAEEMVSRPFVPQLAPPKTKARYYYFATLAVEMLSVSDLDELQRWLRGEAGPAVSGKENPGTALGHGAKELFKRLLGGTVRTYRARSELFRP